MGVCLNVFTSSLGFFGGPRNLVSGHRSVTIEENRNQVPNAQGTARPNRESKLGRRFRLWTRCSHRTVFMPFRMLCFLLFVSGFLRVGGGTAQAAAPQDATRPESEPSAGNEADRLIAQIRNIRTFDNGFTMAFGGSGFAPFPKACSADGVSDENRKGLPTSNPFTRLVALGPTALPSLLRHLDDKTPTKLVVDPPIGTQGGPGGIFISKTLDHNPLNPLAAEIERIATAEAKTQQGIRPMAPYQMLVGDVCFAALGQIVNRRYWAVVGVPTSCAVATSPPTDAIWRPSG